MSELIIMRHGKSEWGSGGVSDHDRDLAPRGIKAATAAGRLLVRIDHVPELVLVSSAVRTQRTLEIAMEAGSWEARVEVRPDLYLASEETVMEIVASRGSSATRVLVIGHEPFCSGLVAALCGANCRFPTAALALLRGPDEWRDWRTRGAVLEWLIPPKAVSAGE